MLPNTTESRTFNCHKSNQLPFRQQFHLPKHPPKVAEAWDSDGDLANRNVPSLPSLLSIFLVLVYIRWALYSCLDASKLPFAQAFRAEANSEGCTPCWSWQHQVQWPVMAGKLSQLDNKIWNVAGCFWNVQECWECIIQIIGLPSEVSTTMEKIF